jgi:hypothetical protein
MDKEFVQVKLDVQEQPDKRALEHPGGMEYMTKWNGKTAGLPFIVMLNEKGDVIINSNSKDEGKSGNIGCPWAPEEQEWFFGMVQKARPKTTKKQIEVLRSELAALKAKTEKKGGG